MKIVGDYAWEQGTQRFGVTASLDEFVTTKDVPFPVKMLRTMETAVAREARSVIVPSDYLKGIVATWGIAEEKIHRIHNGIELPSDIPATERKEGEFLIVSAGRRVPWKGFEAIERVATRHPSWRVFIASDLPREQVLGWMKAADVFVLNSTYEGLSHVLIEAMTLGTPVVATRAGGNGTLVTHEETGLLISPEDDAALERALMIIASDPAAAKVRATAGQKRMEEFSVSRMLDATAAFLKETI